MYVREGPWAHSSCERGTVLTKDLCDYCMVGTPPPSPSPGDYCMVGTVQVTTSVALIKKGSGSATVVMQVHFFSLVECRIMFFKRVD